MDGENQASQMNSGLDQMTVRIDNLKPEAARDTNNNKPAAARDGNCNKKAEGPRSQNCIDSHIHPGWPRHVITSPSSPADSVPSSPTSSIHLQDSSVEDFFAPQQISLMIPLQALANPGQPNRTSANEPPCPTPSSGRRWFEDRVCCVVIFAALVICVLTAYFYFSPTQVPRSKPSMRPLQDTTRPSLQITSFTGVSRFTFPDDNVVNKKQMKEEY